MTPLERRGRLILFLALFCLVYDQVFTIVSALQNGLAEAPWLRGVGMPLGTMFALYYLWQGDDGLRKILGFALIASMLGIRLGPEYAPSDRLRREPFTGRRASGSILTP